MSLTSRQTHLRYWSLGAAILGFNAIRAIDPDRMAWWFPLPTSCGAVTGLPCIFCGMTRALHFLANADFAHALYFNWLAFPIAFVACAFVVLFVAEIGLRRQIFHCTPSLRITPGRISASAALLASLWALQVYLAVSQHKTELLNPSGPLYSVFVK